jgi:hypothetical protein
MLSGLTQGPSARYIAKHESKATAAIQFVGEAWNERVYSLRGINAAKFLRSCFPDLTAAIRGSVPIPTKATDVAFFGHSFKHVVRTMRASPALCLTGFLIAFANSFALCFGPSFRRRQSLHIRKSESQLGVTMIDFGLLTTWPPHSDCHTTITHATARVLVASNPRDSTPT